MASESSGGSELTTMKVTKAQSRALGRYADDHDLGAKREALDELGVARLDARVDGPDALPIAEQIRANAEENRELREQVEKLRRAVLAMQGEDVSPADVSDGFSWDV